MRQIRGLSVSSACALVAAALLWCAVPASGAGDPVSGARANGGTVYHPKVAPGMTLETARSDLTGLLRDRKRPVGIKYYGIQGINSYDRAHELVALLKGDGLVHLNYDDRHELMYAKFKTISVFEDRIEVSPRVVLLYDGLLDQSIDVVSNRDDEYPYVVLSEGLLSFYFHKKDLADAQKFADALYFIQQQQKDKLGERGGLPQFESLAAEYRALKVKPPVSEGQRRFIVQANALNQQKEYRRAIDLYLKAIEMDPVSYPGAYFNLALLSAQLNRFNSAISYMKRYLLLEPEAKDARSAQDKIYEWEIMTGK
jgi:tetratricopeptide (TPR) repeat protein